MATVRLDKLLSNRTPHSRSEIKGILKKGMVQVDGVIVSDGSCKVDPDVQEIRCCGKPLVGQAHTCFLLNKPTGYICATEDRTHPTVLELLPPAMRVKGLFPAGRLDADSTGLVFLTDDGELAHRMLSPRNHVPKYYLVRLARSYQKEYAGRLAQGLTLGDGTVCLPAEVKPVENRERYALICLHEGKYHQVKRMFAAMENHVESLHRVAIGGMMLPPDLPLGGYMEILHKDTACMLKNHGIESIYEQLMNRFPSYSINTGQ